MVPEPETKKEPAKCSVEDCEGQARTRGWCGKHYQRWKFNGDVNYNPDVKQTTLLRKECKLCQNPIHKNFLCKSHYDLEKFRCKKCDQIVYRAKLCKEHYFEQRKNVVAPKQVGYSGQNRNRLDASLETQLSSDAVKFVRRLNEKCRDRRRERLRAGRIEAGEVTITLNDIARKFIFQEMRCHWSGMDFVFVREHLRCPTLDRLDPEKGYTPENTVIACRWANLARNDASVEETLDLFSHLKVDNRS